MTPITNQQIVQFGPGGISQAVKLIIITNVAMFVVQVIAPSVTPLLGVVPEFVLSRGWLWQVVTYQFLHLDVMHLVFNMLFVWMFGVDLERRWGTEAFAKYYLLVGTSAGIATVAVALLPFNFAASSYYAVTIGASGAGYGLMMAWALVFPHRVVYFFGLIPMQARVFALVAGGISLLSALSNSASDIAHIAHLAGLVAGWFYLKTPRRPAGPTRPPSRPRPDYIHRVH